MYSIVCPGIHEAHLTERFVERLLSTGSPSGIAENLLIFPAADRPVYCAVEILQFLRESGAIGNNAAASKAPLLFIGFSAGVVGAIGAAWALQAIEGRVKALIAFDGWGVPLYGNFPIHRVSHDAFTHWSSGLFARGDESFYADPAVEHLALWRSPDRALGWQVPPPGSPSAPRRTTALEFACELLHRYDTGGDRLAS